MRRNRVTFVNNAPNRPPIVVAESSGPAFTQRAHPQQAWRKRVLRRNSDPIQLKQAVQQFLHNYWNEQKKARPVGGGTGARWQAVRRRPFSGDNISNRADLNRPSAHYSAIKRSASVTDLGQVSISLGTLGLEDGSTKQPLETRRQEFKDRFSTHLDLSRLRLKVEKRIERRRSLTHANNQFHDHMANAKTNAVVEKYSTKLCKGRRALSDLALDCMDPETQLSIEEFKSFRRKGNNGYSAIIADSLALSTARSQRKKVSFSAPTTTIYVPTKKSNTPNWEAITFLQQKQLLFPHFQSSQRQQVQRQIQPILARGSRRLSARPLGSSSLSNSPDRAKPSVVFTTITTTIGADYSSAADYPLSHMDFASFKAWRRGSRLSIDVLDMFYTEAERSQAINRQQQTGRQSTQVVQLIKKLLSGCFSTKK